jgi:hypothetical protein
LLVEKRTLEIEMKALNAKHRNDLAADVERFLAAGNVIEFVAYRENKQLRSAANEELLRFEAIELAAERGVCGEHSLFASLDDHFVLEAVV